jgi:hypothetical protein
LVGIEPVEFGQTSLAGPVVAIPCFEPLVGPGHMGLSSLAGIVEPFLVGPLLDDKRLAAASVESFVALGIDRVAPGLRKLSPASFSL